MANSLSNLVNNLAEGVHKLKCKCGHDDKKYQSGIKYKDWECCLEYMYIIDDITEYKYLCFNKNYQRKFNENLKKQFSNICKKF